MSLAVDRDNLLALPVMRVSMLAEWVEENNCRRTLISGSTGLLDPSRKRLRQLGKANEHSVAEKQVRYRAWKLRVSERTSSDC